MAASAGDLPEIEKFRSVCLFLTHSLTHSTLLSAPQQGENAPAATATAQSCISQSFGQSKNYGTLSSPTEQPETLTYAWHNVDIFGAVHQPGSNWRQLVNRTRGIFCNERHIPAPRKHLLKNGKQCPSPGQ